MKILCTFPGRHGDLLWALPTLRALSERFDVPVDLLIAHEFKGLLPILEPQPYLGAVGAIEHWALTPETRVPDLHDTYLARYDRVFHLGYEGWPQEALPFETRACLRRQWDVERDGPFTLRLDLERPWLTGIRFSSLLPADPLAYVEGWTETWFELKVGLSQILRNRRIYDHSRHYVGVNVSASRRWLDEAHVYPDTWEMAAKWIALAPVFVGDCSALHVLAVAMGIPVIVVEPMEARHNPIFYPLGTDGPRVTLLKGGDGKPTFDARHLLDALEPYIARVATPARPQEAADVR